MVPFRVRVCALVLVGGAAALACAEPPVAPAPRAVDVAALVRALGHADFATREAAGARLANLPLDAPPPELLAALKSDDPEVRARAPEVLRAFRAAAAERAIRRLPALERFAVRGQVDLFVASSNTLEIGEEERAWSVAMNAGRILLGKEHLKGTRKPDPAPTAHTAFADYKKGSTVRTIRFDGIYKRPVIDARTGRAQNSFPEAILSAGIEEAKYTTNSLVVSRGPVTSQSLTQSLVFANGNVRADRANSSVVICDGDVVIDEELMCCLIVARGNVILPKNVIGGKVVCGGKVIQKRAAQRDLPPEFANVFVENDAHAYKFVTFFELHRVGIEAKVEGTALVLSAVKGDSVAGRAGLKTGDVVLRAGGAKPADAEALRRALRDALAVGDAKVQVRRAGNTVEAQFGLPE
jgi:hypothetical protein